MPFPDCLQHELRRLVQQSLVYPSYPRVSDEAKALLDALFMAQENRLRLPEMREHQWAERFYPLPYMCMSPRAIAERDSRNGGGQRQLADAVA